MANILIIDDERAIRNTLKEILSYEGFGIEEAVDGEEGLRKLESMVLSFWIAFLFHILTCL
jgi:two-component system nitrogen regulation response regulator NtrX